VGREQEIGLLLQRWARVKDGIGQVVLLSGEAGIGKSRLVQVLKEHVATEPHAWLTPCQCSPYYQNTALYPLIELLERMALRFDREESPQQKLNKLEGFLVQYGLPLAETVPLFTALLSLPLSADYAPLSASPEQQKQQTLQALLTVMLRIAAQQPLLFVMEDLHWVDPLSLSRLNHRLPRGQAHPEVVEGAAEFHHEITDARLPQADAVFDNATALHAAVDMLDPQPPLVERLVG
jgi:predicted ATPase